MKLKNYNQLEVIKSVRRGWGDLNPVTKRIESKKGYNRQTEKNKTKNHEA